MTIKTSSSRSFRYCVLVSLCLARSEAFIGPKYSNGRAFQSQTNLHNNVFDLLDDESAEITPSSSSVISPDSVSSTLSSRRQLFQSVVTTSLVGISALALASPAVAIAEEEPTGNSKILVLGGTGFVGSRVVEQLKSLNIATVVTSTNGRDGTIALDVTKDSDNLGERIGKLAQGCTAVISCIGAIGTTNDQLINAATATAALAAKGAGVKRFVYITVAPEVKEFAKDIDFLQGYMAGKAYSRESVLKSFDKNAVLIEPTFIYGGGSFELNPPRVASFYGQFIEGILSSSPVRTVERVLSPGIVKIALEPPVPVEDVANAAVAGALGKTGPILDTYDGIKQASQQLQQN